MQIRGCFFQKSNSFFRFAQQFILNSNSMTDANNTIEAIELARTLGVSRSLLRFWEEEFELIRHGNGQLSLLEADEIYLIYDLIETKGLALDDAKTSFSIERKRLIMKHKALEKLRDVRVSLGKLRDELAEIEDPSV
jgi:DNA-binding transcriptional MerR regulator